MKIRRKRSNKRAVSPVVATVLLIAIVIALVAIVFFWARGFIKEKVSKFDQPIDYACKDVNFESSSSENSLSISNKGNVPIYKLSIQKIKKGTKDIETVSAELSLGDSKQISLGFDLSGYEEINVIPVLLGKSKAGNKEYTCGEEFGKVLEI